MTVCKCQQLPVSNAEIDSVIWSSVGTTVFWKIEDADTTRLVRGRIYYSARIHGREITTSYRRGILQLQVIA